MAIAAAVQYTVYLQTDKNNNIVLDNITIAPFNDGSFAGATTSSTSITVGDTGQSGNHNNLVFEVITQYPKTYGGTDPGTLRVNDHVINAYNDIQAIINTVPFVGFTGASADRGPGPVIKTFSGLVGGTNYPALIVNGVPQQIVYDQVKLTGGSGQGATASITVSSGGVVTSVVLENPGFGYVAGDVLSWNLKDGVGNVYPTVRGSGGSITVATVGSPITNTNYI